jgi:ABC-type Fe3+-citrate transport system substrate-binding protein
MGKKEKEHRKKVAKRNEKINEQKKKQQKQAMNFLLDLIKKEKEKGAFDGPVMPMPNTSNQQDTNYNQGTEQISLNGPQI